jgi:hypothetical protein
LLNFKKIKEKIYRRILGRKLKNFNPFGSHIPILIGLGTCFKPKRVLELGAGLNSTPIFLNKNCFPYLDQFVSIENDFAWFDKLKTDLKEIDSSHLQYYPGNISEYVKENEQLFFDLILIDDSYETHDRVATIRSVFKSKISDNAVIVIHDFETSEYQEAVKDFPHTFAFVCYLPNVGIVWKDEHLINKGMLQFINDAIEKNKWKYSIYDIMRWKEIFGKKLFQLTDSEL